MGATEDDLRLGRLLREIRRRASLTQHRLAQLADVPVRDLRLVETGSAGAVRLERIRQLFTAAGGRARIVPWWNGAAADRLLDARHAALVERVAAVLRRRGWLVRVELSFSDYGDRGSIDLVAGEMRHLAVAIFEIKSDIGSLEETNRVLDVKERLAPKLALAEFGWRPRHVARVLVLPDDMTMRRLIARHSATMGSLYPLRSREVRAWLRRPDRAMRGIWFLSETRSPRTETA